jgi:hypothetical protein
MLMKRIWTLALLLPVACSGGCTTVTLTEYTICQNRTAGESRDQAVLNCLASVAANPDNLPSYALFSNGITTILDNINPAYMVTWNPYKASAHQVGGTFSRSPRGVWTVDPVVDFERLQALHATCLWALFGPQRAWERHPEILGDAQEYLNQKPHFGVASRLAKLPPDWVHYGRHRDVPHSACYKAHCGDTWIWIMPEHAEAFAQLVLVFQDIATLDINIAYSPPLVVQVTTNEVSKLKDPSDPTKAVTISTSEPRAVKLTYRELINKALQVSLESGKPVPFTRTQWLEYTEPWTGMRTVPVLSPAPTQPGRTVASVPLSTPTAAHSAARLIRPAPDVKFQVLP